jgi:hypothetical protein
MSINNKSLTLVELEQRCKEIKELTNTQVPFMLKEMIPLATLPNEIIIIVSEKIPYDHIKTTEDQYVIKTTYSDFKGKELLIETITEFIFVTIYFVCCSKLTHRCSICRTLKDSICHFRWKSGGKNMSIIYSDFSVPTEIVLNRTTASRKETMFLISDDSNMYKPIKNIENVGIKNFIVKRLPSSVNLEVDNTYKIIIRNEKKDSSYVIKTINKVTYHIFSFHLSELTNISANKEQKINFLKNAGVNEKDSKIMANLPINFPALVRSQSTTGTIDINIVRTEITRAQTVGNEQVHFSPMVIDGDNISVPNLPLPSLRRS